MKPNKTKTRNSLLLLGTALLALPLCLALAQEAPRPLRDADNSPTSVELRISVRHPAAARFRIIENGATLHAGDEMRISLTAGELTYAYIFHRGSTGEWKLIFPNPEESGDATAKNPLLPGEVCSVPGEKSRLLVDGVAGTEELVVYALPHPDSAVIDDLVMRLQRGEHPHIQVAGSPDESSSRSTTSGSSTATESTNSTQNVLTPERDLTIVPAQASGPTNLPANFAVHLKYHNAGSPPASRQP
jgi:hypothetical protein